ncbi:hypothetical protein Daesc_010123 [Daldinia eschscholtzii]|uniref:Uncharacterized protein n=1 Tax=Daldinia eschscholtzii TaxID=292717 RepID=A0AAX6M7K2_9PEZI
MPGTQAPVLPLSRSFGGARVNQLPPIPSNLVIDPGYADITITTSRATGSGGSSATEMASLILSCSSAASNAYEYSTNRWFSTTSAGKARGGPCVTGAFASSEARLTTMIRASLQRSPLRTGRLAACALGAAGPNIPYEGMRLALASRAMRRNLFNS